jgi:benzoyl-CoA-dihydrodiol lyase
MADTPISLASHPDAYVHWKFSVEGDVARLVLDVQEDKPFLGDYPLKLNSYDLGVDIELADAVERIRFEHPEVRVVVLSSGKERVFSAGANIRMLGQSTHEFKINFCKFTNETRLAMEDASAGSGIKFVAALGGITAGGGYELALACDDIVLVDDGNSAVSLPEVPLLGVLPGTGGLTRVVDKRGVRRDLADIFCTLSEGVKGKRAVEWGLVDALGPRSKFDAVVAERVDALRGTASERGGTGVILEPLHYEDDGEGTRRYRFVTLACHREERTARLTVQGPPEGEPETAEAFRERGSGAWTFRAWREIDAALLHLRFNEPECGLVLLATQGDLDRVLAVDRFLAGNRDDWFVKEVLLFQARTLRRLDLTSRSTFALIEPGSCFGGGLLELALAADRSYLLDKGDDPRIGVSALNAGTFPMSHGHTRLQVRFPVDEWRIGRILESTDIDYVDEVRVAIEERASLSPDALTGMEASLRFPGVETCDSKIFGRLSAWQNWIFFRPNAVGEKGALKLYGRPERPEFDWKRT